MIRKIRLSIGFTASMFAGAVGVSRCTVTAWEGAKWNPSREHIRRICALAPTPDYSQDFMRENHRKRIAEQMEAKIQADNINRHREIVEKGRK